MTANLRFFERGHEQLHSLEMHVAQSEAGSLSRQQRLGTIDELYMLLAGGELHLVLLWPRDGRQLGGRGWQ